MSTIEITRVEDVRARDVVVVIRGDTTATGRVHAVSRGLNVHLTVAWLPFTVIVGEDHWTFVRATRDLPDLPTEPGSVIVASGDDYGHPFANVPLMRDRTGVWFGYGPTGNPITVSSPVLTTWTPARIVPEDQS